jgi:hypothetical protein
LEKEAQLGRSVQVRPTDRGYVNAGRGDHGVLWEEDGKPKQDVHACAKPEVTYEITCGPKPLMKSIILELAE